MSFNVGGIDRAVRIVIGLGLMALAFFHIFTGTLAIVGYVVGAIAVVTGVSASVQPGHYSASLPALRKKSNRNQEYRRGFEHARRLCREERTGGGW